jgi:hypothetical protein
MPHTTITAPDTTITAPGGEQAFVDRRPGDAPDDALVLDIGEGVGALVLYTSESLLGAEIEVSPDVDGAPRTHTIIRRRRVNGRDLFAGVYPGLPEGTWRIYGLDDRPVGTVVIDGGRVAEWQGGDCRSGTS